MGVGGSVSGGDILQLPRHIFHSISWLAYYLDGGLEPFDPGWLIFFIVSLDLLSDCICVVWIS